MSPRRRTRARQLAAYSFAILVVGGAILDATVLRHEPKQKAANVEVQTADEPQAALPPPVVANDDIANAVDRADDAIVPSWIEPSDVRAHNRIAVDGLRYTISYQRGDGVTVELRVPGCKRGEIDANGARHAIVSGWAVGHFPDGTYQLTATCDDGTIVRDTTLVVTRDRTPAEKR